MNLNDNLKSLLGMAADIESRPTPSAAGKTDMGDVFIAANGIDAAAKAVRAKASDYLWAGIRGLAKTLDPDDNATWGGADSIDDALTALVNDWLYSLVGDRVALPTKEQGRMNGYIFNRNCLLADGSAPKNPITIGNDGGKAVLSKFKKVWEHNGHVWSDTPPRFTGEGQGLKAYSNLPKPKAAPTPREQVAELLLKAALPESGNIKLTEEMVGVVKAALESMDFSALKTAIAEKAA